MATGVRRHLFLFLAMACFLGIITIFVFQGYMGTYDTIRITSGEYEQTFAPDFWYRNNYSPSVSGTWPGKVFFVYEIDNRQFSTYGTAIRVSVWKESQEVILLLSQGSAINAFGKAVVEWALDTEQLQARGFSEGQYTVKIECNGIERKVLVHYTVYPLSPPKVVPAPVPPRG